MTIRKVTTTAYRIRCERCGRQWTALAVPKRCPSCKAHNFTRPARPYSRTKR